MSLNKIAAVCLAAGQGKRMQSNVQKQYLLIEDKPVLYYALKAFQDSPVDEVVLVVGAGEEDYCKKEIVDQYGFSKVKAVVAGGKERYHSVFCGLTAVGAADYVLIHDGARPFLTQEIIERCIQGAKDDNCNIESTPERSKVWQIQTPQAFDYELIKEAYTILIENEEKGIKTSIPVTDDAMVVEYFLNQKVHLVHGSYENIKITTPEDMIIASAFLKRI